MTYCCFSASDIGTGPTAGFHLELESGVDVVPEQSHFGVGEMPHLVDDLDDVPHGHGVFQFGHAPPTGELTLIVGVREPVSHVLQREADIPLGAGQAQWKDQFAFLGERRHRVEEVARRQDTDFGQS